jgi:hypothetical protein
LSNITKDTANPNGGEILDKSGQPTDFFAKPRPVSSAAWRG